MRRNCRAPSTAVRPENIVGLRVIVTIGLFFIFSTLGCINLFHPENEEELYIEFRLSLNATSNDNYTIFVPVPIIRVLYAELEDEGEPITLMNNLQFIRGCGNYSIELKNQSYYLEIKSNNSIEIGGYMEGDYNNSNMFEKLSSNDIYLEMSANNTLLMVYRVHHVYSTSAYSSNGFETRETELKNGWQTVDFYAIGIIAT